MKKIIYAIWLTAVLLTLLCILFLEPVTAAVAVLVTPLLLLHLAQALGYVHFIKVNTFDENSKLDQSKREQLNSQQAADKYGWALVVEMDQKIKIMQEQIQKAQKARDDFAALVKGEQK